MVMLVPIKANRYHNWHVVPISMHSTIACINVNTRDNYRTALKKSNSLNVIKMCFFVKNITDEITKIESYCTKVTL